MATSESLANFIDELIFQVILSNRHLSARSDIPDTEYRALRFVGRSQPVAVHDIADFLGVTVPRASNVVDSLVEFDMVCRHPGEDRRCVDVTLTDKGEDAIDEIHSMHQKMSDAILDKLSADERRQMLSLIQKCGRSLQAEEMSPAHSSRTHSADNRL